MGEPESLLALPEGPQPSHPHHAPAPAPGQHCVSAAQHPTSAAQPAPATQSQPPARDAGARDAPAFATPQHAVPSAALPRIDAAPAYPPPAHLPVHPGSRPHSRSPSAAGLQLQTDFSKLTTASRELSRTPSIVNTPAEASQTPGTAPMDIQQNAKGLRSTLSAASLTSSLSPSSAISSPALGALADITPLPSPLIVSDSPGPWRRAAAAPGQAHRPDSRGSAAVSREDSLAMLSTGTLSPSRTPSRKNKGYSGLMTAAVEAHSANVHAIEKNKANHSRNRSLSEFVPEHLVNTRPRTVTISAANAGAQPTALEQAASQSQLRREEYLAAQRGLAPAPGAEPTRTLPTPPPSNRGSIESEEEELKEEDAGVEYLVVRHDSGKKKIYLPLRQLGQGAFSKVLLATREKIAPKAVLDESKLNPRKLVAIKVVEHGPAGGADEARVEMTLKREVEVLRSICHPSLIHLKAFDFDDHRALIVLNYCPGGDLYELADRGRDALTAPVVQRLFAELVGAVRYLHSELIVHRDIKLENVLLNVPVSTLRELLNPSRHRTALITLTDLGLCRRIDPSNPKLQTRCGSEDYAAPEILLGQEYDGRLTDAWALGVVLYSLMEGRLPFDPPPGKARGRSRAVHRIARCDWMWCQFGDEDGVWDPTKPGASEWEGARYVVEGLLQKVSRGRKSLDEIEKMDWVVGGIAIEGELRRADEDSDADVVMGDQQA
ncbi:Serine/threonine-protein kinase PRR1 [Lasiodiplodia hormozganensis]|uniref:Serine/threonine-protein kinase PRR1 n=1 Tax=Lasiodiplodia hormozganensis TaxID=869390 RepID=A0AA39YK62_9PEZI|nr:Serine/threonine-protein kinase PRR1 [Lasiodiplodia hormozganensis]